MIKIEAVKQQILYIVEPLLSWQSGTYHRLYLSNWLENASNVVIAII